MKSRLATRQWAIAPEHRVRLELTTQSPADICPATGIVPFVSEPCQLTAPQRTTLPGGTYRILAEAAHPPALHLPQLAYQAFPTARSGVMRTELNEMERTTAPGPYT